MKSDEILWEDDNFGEKINMSKIIKDQINEIKNPITFQEKLLTMINNLCKMKKNRFKSKNYLVGMTNNMKDKPVKINHFISSI